MPPLQADHSKPVRTVDTRGKPKLTEFEVTNRFKVCFCGLPGARFFRRLFPEMGLPPIKPRRPTSRCKSHRVPW
jgi:hypothetical protein